jgi:hypothetical protein
LHEVEVICPSGRFAAPNTHFVIPGRDEVASYDVQLHIRESIGPQAQVGKWIPGSMLRIAPE